MQYGTRLLSACGAGSQSVSEFDDAPDRRGGDSHKWNKFAHPDRDVIGAWVADMDFSPPPAVLNALRERLEGDALGYSEPSPELNELVIDRLWQSCRWRVDPSWLVVLSGVVPGLFGAVRAVGSPGDGVLTQSPNYHHFFGAVAYSERLLQPVQHRVVSGRWEMDFEQFDALAASRPGCFLLCNPHNPVGRVLERHELERLAASCLRNEVMICADEIHADLLLDADRVHTPIASLAPEVERQSITLMSPSKTFNLPGVGGFALAIIPDPRLRAAFESSLYGTMVHPGALACTAALAAYRDCGDWLARLLVYLRGNRDYLQQQVAAMPGISMTHVEATYLAWVNVSELGLEDPFEHFLAHGVALSDGTPMGDSGYLRLNFACPRAILEEIILRMQAAIAAVPA